MSPTIKQKTKDNFKIILYLFCKLHGYNTHYCKPSFIRGISISQFLYKVLNRSVLYSRGTCYFT